MSVCLSFLGQKINPITRFLDCALSGSNFTKKAYFRGATFSGNAYFSGATFSGDAYFSGATFSGDAYFSGATFSEYAYHQALCRSSCYSRDKRRIPVIYQKSIHYRETARGIILSSILPGRHRNDNQVDLMETRIQSPHKRKALMLRLQSNRLAKLKCNFVPYVDLFIYISQILVRSKET
jgi:uncharacterized protein YjbI with pentapeptide repeats